MTIANGGSAKFENDSLLAVNGNALTGNNAAITVERGGTLAVDDKARLRIDNAKNGQTYTIVNNQTGPEQGKWSDGNIEASTDLLTPTMDENGNVTFKRDKDASDVFTGMDGNTAAMLNSLIDKGLNDADSNQMGVRFLSRTVEKAYLGSDKKAAAESIESATRIAFAGAAPQMTRMASDAGTNAVVNRLGFANPADGAQAMDAEGKIVDRNTTGFALWIAPLWQSQHGWGLDAGNMDYGFNGNLGGVSLGADYTFENAIRAGITFNIGGGYAESSGGDLSSTENRMNFWGLGAYAGWNYENFGVMADVSYTSTWNQLKQDLDSRLGMGNKLEADVQASAISAGLRAEYLLQTSAMDIIPHIGVRYMSLNTWGYDVDTHGGTVLEGDSLHQDIWTFPIGVTFSKDFALDSGWNFKPSLDFTVIPAAGDIKAKHDVHFTGLPGTYEVETQMMDYLTWQGGVGLELANDNMSIGVNYTLQAGQHTTGHGVFGSFRYEF
ncbi:autotransporter outer membrane beta-barrel domain-containing protein [Desulfovibrio piger]